MKNLLLILIITSVSAHAQEMATVNFVASKMSKDKSFTIYMNEKNVGTISNSENLQIKLLSTGRFSLIFLYGNLRFTKSIDVEKGQEYYFQVGFDPNWGRNWLGLYESKEEGKKAFQGNEKTLVFEESLENPLSQIKRSDIASEPKQGSGFLVNKEGYILTNFHVIDGAKKIEIMGIKGDFTVPFTARLIAVDRHSDLALLKIETKLIEFENPPYNLLTSDSISKAENVFALGYPMESAMGSEVKVTNGIVNSLTGFKQSVSELQISAAVQGGNSGGPLFNSQGKLIGIISAKIRSDVADQVGYAIKSNYIEHFLRESGVTEFSLNQNQLTNKSISEQVSLISNFVYLIKTE